MKQICSICQVEKNSSEFYFRKDKNELRKDCKLCFSIRRSEYYIENKVKLNEKNKINYNKNKERCLITCSKWRKAHPEQMRVYKNAWKKRNKPKLRADDAKRWATELKAKPKWLSKQHIKEIEYVYKICEFMSFLSGELHHVDHIIPLRGKEVRGLHVPWNLQVLTVTENIKKGNRL